MFALRSAHADIYTWVDASGSINVSNLAPPEGVRVTKVMPESAHPAAGDDAARDTARQAETLALAERVRELENEVELTKHQAPPPPTDYAPVPAPPVVQYIIEPAPAVVQYAVSEPPPSNAWCDSSWLSCGLGFYPSGVVVLPAGRPVKPAPRRRNIPTHLVAQPSLVQPLALPLVQPLLPPPHPIQSFRRG